MRGTVIIALLLSTTCCFSQNSDGNTHDMQDIIKAVKTANRMHNKYESGGYKNETQFIKAEKYYLLALDIDSTYTAGNYGIGRLYYNRAVIRSEQLIKLADDRPDEFNKLQDEIIVYMKKSQPYMARVLKD